MSRINSKLFLVTQIIIQYVDARVTRVAILSQSSIGRNTSMFI